LSVQQFQSYSLLLPNWIADKVKKHVQNYRRVCPLFLPMSVALELKRLRDHFWSDA
jgi:hypothetical protein